MEIDYVVAAGNGPDILGSSLISSPSSDKTSHREPLSPRRWPGVLLSLFVPGFGLVRAGKIGRAVLWFVGLELLGLVIVSICVMKFFPVMLGFVAMGVGLLVVLLMLRDSFRPGRMTRKGWWVFGMLVVGVFATPSSLELIGRSYDVPTGSMEPTLRGRRTGAGVCDRVWVNRLAYLFSQPQRGDVIVFRTLPIPGIAERFPDMNKEMYFVKRVVGLPGEKIEIRDGVIFVDGVRIENGLLPVVHGPSNVDHPRGELENDTYLVGPDHYFVLGDNTANSLDSRNWGDVPVENIYGEVTKIFYPFSRAGFPKLVQPRSQAR